MNLFLLLALTAWLLSPVTAIAESYRSILDKTKDTFNKIETRNKDQCDKKSQIYSQTSAMHREICDKEN